MKTAHTSGERMPVPEKDQTKAHSHELERGAFEFSAVIYQVATQLPLPEPAFSAHSPAAAEGDGLAMVSAHAPSHGAQGTERTSAARAGESPDGAPVTAAVAREPGSSSTLGATTRPSMDPDLQSAIEHVLRAVETATPQSEAHASSKASTGGPAPSSGGAPAPSSATQTSSLPSEAALVRDSSQQPVLTMVATPGTTSEARMWLRHPQLGVLHLDLKLDHGALDLRFVASSDASAAALRDAEQAMRAALSAQGLALKAVDVVVESHMAARFGQGYALASITKHSDRSMGATASLRARELSTAASPRARSRRWRWAFDTEA